jgi:hypothetical protein
MAKQSFKNTMAFLIANGCQENIQDIQWNGCAEGLAETLIENASSNMIFMGTQFSFGKDSPETAIVIANIIIRMLQDKWEYEVCFKDCIDPDLTISRLNKAKKIIREQI